MRQNIDKQTILRHILYNVRRLNGTVNMKRTPAFPKRGAKAKTQQTLDCAFVDPTLFHVAVRVHSQSSNGGASAEVCTRSFHRSPSM